MGDSVTFYSVIKVTGYFGLFEFCLFDFDIIDGDDAWGVALVGLESTEIESASRKNMYLILVVVSSDFISFLSISML